MREHTQARAVILHGAMLCWAMYGVMLFCAMLRYVVMPSGLESGCYGLGVRDTEDVVECERVTAPLSASTVGL